MAIRPIIALELNELCPSLLDKWMAAGELPHFKRLHDESQVFTTTADVTEPDKLEPWIQWYSIHTGLAFDQHGVFHLTDGARADHQDIWRILNAAGRPAMSFASMNVRPFATPGSVFVGDPWTESSDASPAELNIYNRFIAHHVREYSNEGDGLGAADQAAFLRFLATHGLSARTAWTVLRQLATEKAKGPHLSWRRVAILDALQFDVFAHYHARTRPAFASFFANSVAHLQHSYWRCMEPDAFTVKPKAEEAERYGDAIRFGYQAMDALVGRFRALAARTGALLVFQTALSQQPFTKYEEKGGQHFHRLRDVDAFLRDAGIGIRADPVMAHQYKLIFGSAEEERAAAERLEAFRLEDGRIVFDCTLREGLLFGAQIFWAADPATPIVDHATGRRMRLGDILYPLDGTKSGCHHPDGALWIATGSHCTHLDKVSILDTLPTLLDLLETKAPGGERRGASLLPRFARPAVAA